MHLVWITCVYRLNSYVADICVIHMFYTCCNAHKTPEMHYICGIIGHVAISVI